MARDTNNLFPADTGLSLLEPTWLTHALRRRGGATFEEIYNGVKKAFNAIVEVHGRLPSAKIEAPELHIVFEAAIARSLESIPDLSQDAARAIIDGLHAVRDRVTTPVPAAAPL